MRLINRLTGFSVLQDPRGDIRGLLSRRKPRSQSRREKLWHALFTGSKVPAPISSCRLPLFPPIPRHCRYRLLPVFDPVRQHGRRRQKRYIERETKTEREKDRGSVAIFLRSQRILSMLEQKGWRSNDDREAEESGSSRGRRNLIYV